MFDLETTGIDVARDRIVTASVGVLDESGEVVAHRDWLADPGVDIPASAQRVHGVSSADARQRGRAASEVVAEIVDALSSLLRSGTPVVAYNAPFDFSLLKHEALRYGVEPIETPCPVIDPLVIDKKVDRFRRGKRTLDTVAAHYAVPLEGAHDATVDAVAAGRVAQAIGRRWSAELPVDALDLHAQQIEWAREQAQGLSEYLVRVGKLAAGELLDGSWPVR